MAFLLKNKIKNCNTASCPSCGETRNIEEWNDLARNTYGEHSPDIRLAAEKKSSFPFQCPNCYCGYSAHLLEFK